MVLPIQTDIDTQHISHDRIRGYMEELIRRVHAEGDKTLRMSDMAPVHLITDEKYQVLVLCERHLLPFLTLLSEPDLARHIRDLLARSS
jgi:GTP cyclohydrolase I